MNKPCIQSRIILRKVQRHPMTRRVVFGTKVAIIPDVVNDVAFHHAQVNTDEVIHAFQDSLFISIIHVILKLRI